MDSPGAKNIGIGLLWFIGGTVVTLATYSAAQGGGTYVVAYGAIAVGAIQVLIGIGQMVSGR